MLQPMETMRALARDARTWTASASASAREVATFVDRFSTHNERKGEEKEEYDVNARAGVGTFVRAIERVNEGFDVRHAHVEARAANALRFAAALDDSIARQEGRWCAMELELSEVSQMTAKVWEYGESLCETIEMMGELEEMLLEAEIGAQLEALYRRRDDAELAELEAEAKFQNDIAHVRQLQDLLASDAMTNQVSSRTTEEIVAEQELKRKLASLAKKKSRESAPGGNEEQTLAGIASTLDVSANISASELDDFFTQDDDERGAETSGKAYTLYGLRARADQSKGAILNEPPIDNKPIRGVDEETAERIAQARKEALGIRDEDMVGVNLRPPPPSGGAGSSPLDEAQSPRKIVIESKSVTGQVSDRASKLVEDLRSFSFSAAATAAAESAAAAAAAAANAVSDVTTLLRKQGANEDVVVRAERDETAEAKQAFYKKKDAGTSTT